MRAALIPSALAFAVTTARAQEAVLLRIGGQPGQTIRYQQVTDLFMRGGPMAAMMRDTTQPFQRTTLYETRTLTAVSGDTLTFQQVIDSSRVESPAMPQMSAMMSAMGAMINGTTTVTKMSRRGHIYSHAITSTGGMAGMPMGPGGRGPGGPMGGGTGQARNVRGMFALPAAPVRPGDSWSDSGTVQGDSLEPTVTFQATFKLDSLVSRGGSRLAGISMAGKLVMTPQRGPAMNMDMTGDVLLDLSSQRLRWMTMTTSGTVQTPQGEVPMKIQTTQTQM